jgi:hypothetical protein
MVQTPAQTQTQTRTTSVRGGCARTVCVGFLVMVFMASAITQVHIEMYVRVCESHRSYEMYLCVCESFNMCHLVLLTLGKIIYAGFVCIYVLLCVKSIH